MSHAYRPARRRLLPLLPPRLGGPGGVLVHTPAGPDHPTEPDRRAAVGARFPSGRRPDPRERCGAGPVGPCAPPRLAWRVDGKGGKQAPVDGLLSGGRSDLPKEDGPQGDRGQVLGSEAFGRAHLDRCDPEFNPWTSATNLAISWPSSLTLVAATGPGSGPKPVPVQACNVRDSGLTGRKLPDGSGCLPASLTRPPAPGRPRPAAPAPKPGARCGPATASAPGSRRRSPRR